MKISAAMFLTAAILLGSDNVLADAQCLLGEWSSEKESIAAKPHPDSETAASLLQSVDILSGSFYIEILEDATVRITYDNYETSLTTTMGGRTRTVKAVFSGTAEGKLSGGGNKLALRRFSKIDVEAYRQMPDGKLVSAGKDKQGPPHEEDSYEFECKGNELLLTHLAHSNFGGAEYKGRLVRDN